MIGNIYLDDLMQEFLSFSVLFQSQALTSHHENTDDSLHVDVSVQRKKKKKIIISIAMMHFFFVVPSTTTTTTHYSQTQREHSVGYYYLCYSTTTTTTTSYYYKFMYISRSSRTNYMINELIIVLLKMFPQIHWDTVATA